MRVEDKSMRKKKRKEMKHATGEHEVKPVTKKAAMTFARQPKKPQRDDPVADRRPTAHGPAEAKKSSHRKELLKRLGHRVI